MVRVRPRAAEWTILNRLRLHSHGHIGQASLHVSTGQWGVITRSRHLDRTRITIRLFRNTIILWQYHSMTKAELFWCNILGIRLKWAVTATQLQTTHQPFYIKSRTGPWIYKRFTQHNFQMHCTLHSAHTCTLDNGAGLTRREIKSHAHTVSPHDTYSYNT